MIDLYNTITLLTFEIPVRSCRNVLSRSLKIEKQFKALELRLTGLVDCNSAHRLWKELNLWSVLIVWQSFSPQTWMQTLSVFQEYLTFTCKFNKCYIVSSIIFESCLPLLAQRASRNSNIFWGLIHNANSQLQ